MKFFAVFAAVVAVAFARPAITDWSLEQLSDALQNPHTNPALVPIFEQALNDFMDALYAGQYMETIHVSLPEGIPLYSEVSPAPVLPPVIPSPVVPAPTADSPLVQIIVNVNGGQQVADVIAPAPVVPPMPSPLPVPVPEPVIIPEPVLVQELPPVPVIVAPLPEAPIVVAPLPVNPIDVIAVNPVDTWGPNGLIPVAAGSGNEVGPM